MLNLETYIYIYIYSLSDQSFSTFLHQSFSWPRYIYIVSHFYFVSTLVLLCPCVLTASLLIKKMQVHQVLTPSIWSGS